MRNRDWAGRFEEDLEKGQEAVQKARLDPSASEYRRLLSLGIRLKAAEFSGESRIFQSALDELMERHENRRGIWLQRLPTLAARTIGGIVVAASIIGAFLLLSRLPELNQSMGPVAPDLTEAPKSEIRSMISQDHLELINLALMYESWQGVYSYDPELRVPTKISGIWEAPYRDTMAGSNRRQDEIDPQTVVQVVRMEGYWYDTVIEPDNEWVTKMLEIVWSPEHEAHRYGSASGEPPFIVSPSDVPSTYSQVAISPEAIQAINSALVVESWFPQIAVPFVGLFPANPPRIERVVAFDPTEIPSMELTLFEEGMQLDVEGEIWAVRMTGKWEGSKEMAAEARARGADPGEFDHLIVFIDPETHERLGWSIATFDKNLNFYDISDDLRTHTVSKNETLFDFSERYNLDTDIVAWTLWRFSSLSPDKLEEGMQLLLPPSNGVLHVWRPLDTLELVAEDYGVESQWIENAAGNASHLIGSSFVPDAGDVIFIPMPRQECEFEMRLPGYIRCEKRE